VNKKGRKDMMKTDKTGKVKTGKKRTNAENIERESKERKRQRKLKAFRHESKIKRC
jgi:hypothetical protein